MILVDTSIWINHLRKSESRLVELLIDGLVDTHDYVIGELAAGNLKQRDMFLQDIQTLPRLQVISMQEILKLIEMQKLMGKGLGYVDISLLASCLVNSRKLWTNDRRLLDVARKLGVAFTV